MIWIVTWIAVSVSFVLGTMFGYWVKGNDDARNVRMAEAKELHRVALLHRIARCEQQIEKGKLKEETP